MARCIIGMLVHKMNDIEKKGRILKCKIIVLLELNLIQTPKFDCFATSACDLW